MGDKQIIHGGVFNGPVGFKQRFENCYNAIDSRASQENLKEQLKSLYSLVVDLANKLPEDDDKEAVQLKLDTFVSQATAKKPDRSMLEVTAQGLKDAAVAVAEIATPIATTIKSIFTILGLVT